ncbi:VOC family protein [Qipengyuania sp. 6D47A]|uniref:VOC family protein n=2 Tax=Qipengyuania qiaonensis TaxID=2867240 RepID=A0ABS7J7W6_9SPHN|nr:VOC family protein [Qipengyuania qiaonensis]MBX7483416.1 VOC family protein [Qipengyuania qiaonensis]
MTALMVPDYDEAIAFFRDALGFALQEDSDLGGTKRWVVMAGSHGGKLLLARAADAQQRAAIGNQTGGRVGWFLHTDNFASTHARMTAWGVEFTESPRRERYGTVAVFNDPWGNRWDLIEHRKAA